ncbi:MAG: prepilin-type N-terminal cleavage/methylation domain-containing protein [Candidatus Gracilibacteria bacterium]|nr:prepilin-type N-terminal cleavage/methylation domain-containing protein [Candidatus Gracilibacteria bacterium]
MQKKHIHYTYKYAFTLVELIVVITILAILGTIAFISYTGFSVRSRDGVRLSDIFSIKTSMDLYEIDNGKYPIPSNGINVTYSGAIVWNQGTFGESVYTNISKLDKIPLDPLTGNQYSYSVTQDRIQYQIAGIIEGDEISMISDKLLVNNFIPQVNAGDVYSKALVKGNYNGIVSKVINLSNCDILSVPSIITSELSLSTDYVDLHDSGWLVYNGFNNLPATYKKSKFYLYGGFDFFSNNLLVYSDNNNCSELFSNTNSGTLEKVKLLKGIQDGYNGTLFADVGEIKNILDLDIDINNPNQTTINYSKNLVNNLTK